MKTGILPDKFKTVEQMVNSYFVASTVYEIRDEEGPGVLQDNDHIQVERIWALKTEDKVAIGLYKRMIQLVRHNVKLMAIAKVAIDDMDRFKFKTAPSVSANQRDNENLRSKYAPSEFDMLRKVNLYDHTLHVFENIIVEIESREVYNSGIIMLACLLHDFGKSQEIRKKVAPDSVAENASQFRQHPEVSGTYVKDYLYEKVKNVLDENKEDSSIRKTIDTISEIVINHHQKNNAWVKKLELINRADWKARENELKEAIKR